MIMIMIMIMIMFIIIFFLSFLQLCRIFLVSYFDLFIAKLLLLLLLLLFDVFAFPRLEP